MNMRFVRNNRIKQKLVDLGSKALAFAISALICLWMISGARAANLQIEDIREETGADGTHAIAFRFSSPVDGDQVGVEFQRNFIQLSLKGVSAYPARTKNLDHTVLEKVFTYQYQPDLARARILLKGPASQVEKETSWTLKGDTLRIMVGAEKVIAAVAADSVKTKSAAAEDPRLAAAEDKVVQEILQKAKEPKAPAQEAAKAAPVNSEDQPVFSADATKGSAAEAKSKEPAATKVFASLLMVVGVIGAAALAFRRFVLGKGMSLQKQGKVIEVVSSQSMGPKRSIALVKVLDQYMVVGMSGDGMNLLANLGSNVDIDKYLDEIGPGASFSATFRGTMQSQASSDAAPVQKTAADNSIRSAIKKRIEGFKPL